MIVERVSAGMVAARDRGVGLSHSIIAEAAMSTFRKVNLEAAGRVGQVLNDLYVSCYSFSAILAAGADASARLGSSIDYTIARPLPRRNGTAHSYSFQFYLRQAFDHAATAAGMQTTWFASAIVAAADALKPHNYFNRPPALEVIYHLRNGIAHGNKFDFTPDCRARMAAHPANTEEWAASSAELTPFHITESLHGSGVLFDYMGPADITDVLIAGHLYLGKLAQGQIQARQY